MANAKPNTWMPMYWGDYFRDTRRLSTLEHGAYLLLIGEYWVSGRPLPSDDATLARLTGTSPAEWSRIKPSLEPLFTVADGEWRHKRIAAEYASASRRYEQKSAAAQARWGADKKPRKSEPDAPAQEPDPPRTSQPQPQPHSPNGELKPNPNGLVKKPTKGTRIGSDWYPDQQDRDFCWRELGWNDERTHAEADKFRDYWIANPKGVKLDWRATWRNWCRRAYENAKPVSNRPGRATEGERRNAILASVAGELGDRGDATSGLRESGSGFSGSASGPDADTAQDIRGADGSTVRVAAFAAQGIPGDLAGVACEVSPGRSETSLGSRSENPQMGNSTEDRADGGGGGNRRELSAAAGSKGHAGEGDFTAGMGQAGADEFPEIPEFLRRA